MPSNDQKPVNKTRIGALCAFVLVLTVQTVAAGPPDYALSAGTMNCTDATASGSGSAVETIVLGSAVEGTVTLTARASNTAPQGTTTVCLFRIELKLDDTVWVPATLGGTVKLEDDSMAECDPRLPGQHCDPEITFSFDRGQTGVAFDVPYCLIVQRGLLGPEEVVFEGIVRFIDPPGMGDGIVVGPFVRETLETLPTDQRSLLP